MERLNYHHLFYFWVVAKEGTIAAACKELHVEQHPAVAAIANAVGEVFQQRIATRE